MSPNARFDRAVTLVGLGTALTLSMPSVAGADQPADTQRTSAARTTAESDTNACRAIRPFYWEIGNRTQRLAGGAVGGSVYSETTVMPIASASKWLYAAYVAERRGGALNDDDVKFLTFRSGYDNFSFCLPGQSVNECRGFLKNGSHSAATEGRFSYDGGHMQEHASRSGLGALRNPGLAAAIRSRIGRDVGLTYSSPQLAGAVVSTPSDYARFLRKLLTRELRMGGMLGTHAVCTNPATCRSAASTPVPRTESWHYSLGHWVEDDPAVGDGAFSSPGTFGFYPWIDAGGKHYGIVARKAGVGAWHESAVCGRLIRKAWASAAAK